MSLSRRLAVGLEGLWRACVVGAVVEHDSRYQAGSYYRPSKRTTWNNVTGHQVIAEAAAHRNGRVVLAVYVDRSKSVHGMPLWVQQIW